MKTQSDPERLLDEVLLEESAFEATTLAGALREVRRKQARRVRNKAAALLVSTLLAVTAGLWVTGPSARQSRLPGIQPPSTSVAVVHSKPLTSETWVDSSRFHTPTIESMSDIPVVASHPTRAVQQIDDGELFALLDGQPAALVLPSDGTSPALVLVSEEDQPSSLP
jgi:hypothetical protein